MRRESRGHTAGLQRPYGQTPRGRRGHTARHRGHARARMKSRRQEATQNEARATRPEPPGHAAPSTRCQTHVAPFRALSPGSAPAGVKPALRALLGFEAGPLVLAVRPEHSRDQMSAPTPGTFTRPNVRRHTRAGDFPAMFLESGSGDAPQNMNGKSCFPHVICV